MRKLTKLVERETMLKSPRGKTLMIELNDMQEITFREKGRKTRYHLHLLKAYRLSIICAILDEYQEKMTEYKIKRKSGVLRLRKPQKPSLTVFSSALKLAANV